MTDQVKLKNISQRIFVLANEVTVKPNEAVLVDAAEAVRLMGLYPDELMDLAFEASAPVTGAPIPTAAEKVAEMTVKELREALKAKGVEFKPAASKADLVALMNGTVTGDPTAPAAASVAAIPATILTATTTLEAGVVYTDENGTYVGAKNGETVGLLPVDKLTVDEKAALVAEGKLPA